MVHNALHLWRPRSDPGKSNEGPRFLLPLPQQAPANQFTSGSVRNPPSALILQNQCPGTPCLPVRGHPQPGQAPCEDKTMPTSRQGHGHLSMCPAPPPLGGLERDAVKALFPFVEVPLPGWVGYAPGGVLAVPAGPPREGCSAKRAGGETSYRMAQGCCTPRPPSAPLRLPTPQPKKGRGDQCPLQRDRDTGDNTGLPWEDGGCTVGLAGAPQGVLHSPTCTRGKQGEPPPQLLHQRATQGRWHPQTATPSPPRAWEWGGPPGKVNVEGLEGKGGLPPPWG